MPSPTVAADAPAQAASALDAYIRQLTAALLLSTRNLWSTVQPNAILASWSMIAAQVVAQLAASQIRAAREAADYVPEVLAELGMDATAEGEVVPAMFAVGSSGMPLEAVVGSAPLRALSVASSDGTSAGLDAGWNLLQGIIETQVADSARQATSAGMTVRRSVRGFIRQVEPGACGRCVALAGKWYRYNAAFLRHDRCRCYQIPAAEDVAGSWTSDPDAYFRSLSRAQQDKTFTRAGAQAIRDGADISRVVNARRGALGLTPAGPRLTEAEKRAFRNGNEFFGHLRTTNVFGQQLYTTTEATTVRRGIGAQLKGSPRLLPESIYEIARSRDDAIALLKRFGYIR